jgi:hypothetical protein
MTEEDVRRIVREEIAAAIKKLEDQRAKAAKRRLA